MASRARALLAPLVVLAAVLGVAGCVSVPSAGPVLSYQAGQQPSGQNGQNIQVIAAGPAANWSPNDIVTGFLTAAAAIGDQQVARAYLTPQESRDWNPSWNAYVYKSGPFVQGPRYQQQPAGSQRSGKSAPAGASSTTPGTRTAGAAKSVAKAPERATVEVNGTISAILSGHDNYAVPSSSARAGPEDFDFELVKDNGQWRISGAPSDLLLTQGQFADDYELRNLYFFDPSGRYLVPDPVYVPLQATTANLVGRLVTDLITPPRDWLAEATQTAFPAGTKPYVTVADQLATVQLTGKFGSAQSQQTLWPQVAAQLLWTLVGSGEGSSQVQSVELIVNGKPWPPAGSPNDSVQTRPQASYQPASGASQTFYYLDSTGYLDSRDGIHGKPVQIARIGTGYSQIAVSPDGRYLAALRGQSLYIGPVDGPLAKRQGSGYTSISWDASDNLWTTNAGQLLAFRGDESPGSPLGRPITAVGLPAADNGLITAVRVAPDGVRVALIVSSDELTFGAIVWQQGPGPSLGESARIELSPFSAGEDQTTAGFAALAWYGPDDVITLSNPGSILTEYPVNGGTSTSQVIDQPVVSIAASSGQALIAGVAREGMYEAPTLTGAWNPIGYKGSAPTYPG